MLAIGHLTRLSCLVKPCDLKIIIYIETKGTTVKGGEVTSTRTIPSASCWSGTCWSTPAGSGKALCLSGNNSLTHCGCSVMSQVMHFIVDAAFNSHLPHFKLAIVIIVTRPVASILE